MQKYVQSPVNLYCNFCKSVGHDEKDCRSLNLLQDRTRDVYDMIHDRPRDTYRIQGEQQQDPNQAQYNSPGRVNFNNRGEFRGRGRGGGSSK